MEGKKINFPMVIIAVILGVALFKKFDFQTFTFEKPALAIVYFICFVMSLYFIFNKSKS